MKTLPQGLEQNKKKDRKGTTELKFPWKQLSKTHWNVGIVPINSFFFVVLSTFLFVPMALWQTFLTHYPLLCW